MTEEDAKTKWCPAARIAVAVRPSDDLDYASNRPMHDPYNCIGSACMAWRWANDYERRWDLPADKAPEGKGWQRVEAIGGVAHWVRQHETPSGYCGLAGSIQ